MEKFDKMEEFANLSISDDGVARKVVVACDFGTTFSGLAWAQTSKVGNSAHLVFR